MWSAAAYFTLYHPVKTPIQYSIAARAGQRRAKKRPLLSGLEQAERVAVEIMEHRLHPIRLIGWHGHELDPAPRERLVVALAIICVEDPRGALPNPVEHLLAFLRVVPSARLLQHD